MKNIRFITILVIMASLLLINTTALATAPTESEQEEVILERNLSGGEVIDLQLRLRDLGYFYYKETGYYGTYTVSSVKAFQEANGLQVDGQAGPETLDVLYSSSAIRNSVHEIGNLDNIRSIPKIGEALDWFEKVQYIYTKGSVAKVTDVDTGKVFYMQRIGGYNHADVESVSTKDSETIQEIWGGWSWARRAVIVEVNGYSIAASMHGYPHSSYDIIGNNGMTGHVCIHFLNSRTHYSNKEDPDHQAMVQKAAGSN